MGAGQTATLQITSELKNLARLRAFIQNSASKFGIDQAVIDDMLLAADEAVTNVILHGYRDQPGKIDITIEQAEESLIVYLRDRAPPFDPTTVPSPDLSLPLHKRPLGKMGIYLMRKLTDELIYHPSAEGGNELILIKKGIWQNRDSHA